MPEVALRHDVPETPDAAGREHDLFAADSLGALLNHPSATALLPANAESDPSLINREIRYQRLHEIKCLLRHGTLEDDQRKILPFTFRQNGETFSAETAGLEGFLFSERHFVQRFGAEASVALVDHYIKYSRSLLRGGSHTKLALDRLQEIENEFPSAQEKYRAFIGFLHNFAEDLRAEVRALDPARWSHWARAYHIFVRAFNLPGRREAFELAADQTTGRIFEDLLPSDIEQLRKQSFNCIRYMGTYPIGETNRKGEAGGSPFSVRNFEVDPAHGSEPKVQEFIRASASHGMRSVFEIVLNHTAADCSLLEVNPRLYVHTQNKPQDMNGYYHYISPRHGEFWIRQGGYCENDKWTYWNDTLQLDLSKPETRSILAQITCEIVRRYGVHALRFDAAENMLHDQWSATWGKQVPHGTSMPKVELLTEIVHAVKSQFPSVVCIAEAYKHWDKMSSCGFDLIYGIEDMGREVESRHPGWQASLVSRDPDRIRATIRRAEFLHWQEGGADMSTFWGHQDMKAPWNIFGEDWKWGAATLTILKPGPFSFYASAEALYECPETLEQNDPKAISFNRKAHIDWSGIKTPFGRFQLKLLELYRELQITLGEELHFQTLEPFVKEETWVGYVIQAVGAAPTDAKVAVIVNPAPQPTTVSIKRPDLGIESLERVLPACGKDSVKIAKFPKKAPIN